MISFINERLKFVQTLQLGRQMQAASMSSLLMRQTPHRACVIMQAIPCMHDYPS